MTQIIGLEDTNLDGLTWRKAQQCSAGSCVEFAQVDENNVAIRNSNNPGKAPLLYTKEEWSTFVDGVKKGEFDLN